MAKIKIETDDAEAVLNLVDVLTGKRSAGVQFIDRRDRTRLSPFYQVAVMNLENAIRQRRQRPAQLAAKKSCERV